MTFNFPCRIPSLCLYLLLFCGPLAAQQLPPVTPANTAAVVQALQARLGTEINIPASRIQAFFSQLLQNYQSNLPAPAIRADSSSLNQAHFSWKSVPSANLYTVAWLDLKDGISFDGTTPAPKYSFTDLEPDHLYLFVVASRKSEGSSALCVTAGKTGFIIIDDKIFITGKECDFFSSLAGGPNQAFVPLLPGQSRLLRVLADPCTQTPTIPGSDAFFLRVENQNGTTLTGKFYTTCPMNQNNAISGFNSITFPNLNTANLLFAPASSPIVSSFSVVNTTPNLCVFLTIEECHFDQSDKPEITGGGGTSWQISPNPTAGQLVVRLEAPLPGDGWLELRNAWGQVLERYAWPSGEVEYQLDLSAWPAGLYGCSLLSAAGTESRILVKN